MPPSLRPPTLVLGDRVRRVAHAGSATIQALLRCYADQGLGGVPVPLSLANDVEELTFVPGVCWGPTEPRPPLGWRIEVLEALARLLRVLHDASVPFLEERPNGLWFPYAEATKAVEVVCHNDLGPWNVAVQVDGTVGVIDWEMAAPGPRLWDLAHLAWNWVPFFPPDERVRMGCAPNLDIVKRSAALTWAYGRPDLSLSDLAAAAVARQDRALALVALAESTGDPLLANWMQVDSAVIRADIAYTRALAVDGVA